jgi:transketolase
MENTIKWHHGVPSKDEYAKAIEELDTAMQAL